MDKIKSLFAEAIQKKIFSGAQVIFGKGDSTRLSECFGTVQSDPDSRPVGPYTLFDVASLTKPVVTATLCMLAYQEGRLKLDAELREYLPNFQRAEKIRILDLLQHQSGLPAWLPLFEEARNKGWSYEEVREFYIERIAREPLATPLGSNRVYSDLGFILLGFVLEKIKNRRIERDFHDSVASPLKMEQTLFNPVNHPEQASPRDIAATELCPWRGRLLWGEVHDDNANVLYGAAGHAGLFATALDLETFVREIFAATKGKGRLIDAAAWRTFLGAEVFPKLGWDTVSRENSQAGTGFSPLTSIGHLAFTGCSLWIDLQDEKYLILLTNRVHPTRENEAIKEFRPKIHDEILRL